MVAERPAKSLFDSFSFIFIALISARIPGALLLTYASVFGDNDISMILKGLTVKTSYFQYVQKPEFITQRMIFL